MRSTPEEQVRLDAGREAGTGVGGVLFGRGDVMRWQARDADVERVETLPPPPAITELLPWDSLALHPRRAGSPLIGSSARGSGMS